MNEEDVKVLIRRRRAQMLVHSCIYYELDDNIISDDQWQKWADELCDLQTKYPNCTKIDYFDFDFNDWTGATGNHLPHRHPKVYGKAVYILNLVRGMKK